MLASAGRDRAVRVWDLRRNKLKFASEKKHKGPMLALAFTDDDKTLVAGGYSGEPMYYDTATGAQRPGPSVNGRVYRIKSRPKAGDLAFATSMPYVQVLRAGTTRMTRLYGHSRDTNDLAYSPDGRLLVSGSDDGTVRLWDAATGEPKWYGTGLVRNPVRAFSHLGMQTFVGEKTVRKEPTAKWQVAMGKPAAFGVMSLDGRLVCMRTASDKVTVWDVGRDLKLSTISKPVRDLLPLKHGCVVRGVAQVWMVDGRGRPTEIPLQEEKPVAIGAGLGDVLVATKRAVSRWSVVELTERGARAKPKSRTAVAGALSALTIIQDSGGKPVWVLGYPEGNIELRDPRGDLLQVTFTGLESAPVSRLMQGPPGTLIVGYDAGIVGLWTLKTGLRVRKARLSGNVRHLILDKSRLYAATDLGGTLVWDVGIFTKGRCALMREIWKDVPVVWDMGRVVVQAPPTDDPCFVDVGGR